MHFTRELHDGIASGAVTVSVRLWSRPQAKLGGRYRVGDVTIEVDDIEIVPFASITAADVRRTGSADREALRALAAHAGPIADETLVYRIEFHTV
ncbi:MAG: ASCH domain-containing protein [Acidimicrobiia bacterium]